MSDILTGLFGFNAIQKAEKETWITIKGTPVKIKDGQSKGDAVKEFLAKKGGSKKTRSNTKRDRANRPLTRKQKDEDLKNIENDRKEMVGRSKGENERNSVKKLADRLSEPLKDKTSTNSKKTEDGKKTDSTYDRAVSKVDAFGKKNRASGKPMVGSKEANKESDARKRKEDDAFISNDKKDNAKKTESGEAKNFNGETLKEELDAVKKAYVAQRKNAVARAKKTDDSDDRDYIKRFDMNHQYDLKNVPLLHKYENAVRGAEEKYGKGNKEYRNVRDGAWKEYKIASSKINKEIYGTEGDDLDSIGGSYSSSNSNSK